jgi:glycosyltransferase involved in cell wall biosynthesis
VSGARTLAVVVKGWPRLSETFIAQELVALEEAGLTLELWSLRHPTDSATHPLHHRLRARVTYLPEYLRNEPRRVARAMGAAADLPGFDAAAEAYAADLARDDTANRRRRWGQACVLATEAGPDTGALYAHFLHTPASVARYAAMIRNLPWAASAHAKDIWTSPDWEIAEKLGDQPGAADFAATCTAYGAGRLRGLAGDADKVDLVYHGLDLSRFPHAPQRPRREPGGPLRLLSVGRLVEKKGFDRLIAALALLPETLDWHWTHIGGGELAGALEAQAEAAGIAERISWRGACDQPQVISAMRAADVFVLPSRVAADGDRDGLPNVLMEAASQMLPILTTPVSAIPEFIEDGIHGVLSDDAPGALAAAICRFADDPAFGPALAMRALARLRAEFTMAPGIARLHDRLSRMLSRTG